MIQLGNLNVKKKRKGILKDYLVSHKAEVIGMCITEYNEQETMYAFREEGREEEREEGLKALVETLKKFTNDFETLYKAVVENKNFANVTVEQVRKYY